MTSPLFHLQTSWLAQLLFQAGKQPLNEQNDRIIPAASRSTDVHTLRHWGRARKSSTVRRLQAGGKSCSVVPRGAQSLAEDPLCSTDVSWNQRRVGLFATQLKWLISYQICWRVTCPQSCWTVWTAIFLCGGGFRHKTLPNRLTGRRGGHSSEHEQSSVEGSGGVWTRNGEDAALHKQAIVRRREGRVCLTPPPSHRDTHPSSHSSPLPLAGTQHEQTHQLCPERRLRIQRHRFLCDSYPEHRLRSWFWSYYSA